MQFQKVKTALIGCGMISKVYLENLKKLDIIELVGCSDLVPERATKRAEQFGIRATTNEEILADPEITLIINTTYPLAHYEVARAALLAGKHVYTEKTLCETVEQADELLTLARERGLFCGGAPDTFFSGSIQLARQILDSGILGTPTMVDAFLARSYKHERFFKGEEKRFAFCRHGGIVFDMGSYYLTQMIFLLGNLVRVSGFSQIRDPERVYMNPASPLYGKDMTVETPNNVTSILEFAGGALGHLTVTSEGGCTSNRFVIHCTDGMIDLGDPNNFESSVRIVNKKGESSIISTPFAFRDGNLRGLGAADAMYALQAGRRPRCDGDLCRHVLEAALAMVSSSTTNTAHWMKTTCERPAPLPLGHTEYPELALAL